MDKRIVVPEGMAEFARQSAEEASNRSEIGTQSYVQYPYAKTTKVILKAALKWLSENPIVPTLEQTHSLCMECTDGDQYDMNAISLCTEWQRRMFLAPVVPEEVKDLLVIGSYGGTIKSPVEEHNRKIIEVFNRGKKAANR